MQKLPDKSDRGAGSFLFPGEQDIGSVAGTEHHGQNEADLDDSLENLPDDRKQNHSENDCADGEYVGVSRRLTVVLIVHTASVASLS